MCIYLGRLGAAQHPLHMEQYWQGHLADCVLAAMHPRGPQINALEQCSAVSVTASQQEQVSRVGLSSGYILPGQPSPVVVTQSLVHCPDIAIDQVLHLRGEGLCVMRAPATPPEAALFVVLHTEKPFLTHRDVEEGHHLPQCGHQAVPQLLIVHNQQPLPILEPV